MKKSRRPEPRQFRLREEDLENPFLEEQNARFHLERGGRLLLRLCVILLVLMPAAVLFRYDFVHTPVSAARYLSEVSARFGDLWRLLSGGGDVNGMSFSLCTIVIVALVGGCLSVCGSVCQGIFHTPMASPTMLGIQSGGMVAAVAYLFFCGSAAESAEYFTFDEYNTYLDSLSFYQMYAQQLWMLGGCLVGAAIVVFLSSRAGRGKISAVVMILTGSLFSAFANAAVSLGQYYFTYVDATTNRVYALMTISMGTFANVYTLKHLIMLGVPVAACMAGLFAISPGLNALMFGDEEARAAGLNVPRFRRLAFVLCIVPCAVVLSFCGQISFVGLIVPHFARQMAGSDCRRLLPAAALLGAIAMVLVYAAALCTGLTTSVNLVTSVVGGALFLAFLLRYRRCRNADWA